MGAIDKAEDAVIRPESVTEQVYRILKSRITSGELIEGQHLVEATLAAEFGVSKTPIREALARLERDGLVDIERGKGAVVHTASIEEIRDILEVRGALEGLAAEKAALVITAEDIDELAFIISTAETALSNSDLTRYKELDEEFHDAVMRISGNHRLMIMRTQLRDLVRLVMTTSVTLPGRPEQSIAEHKKILHALKKRDACLAGSLAREHIVRINAAVIQHLESAGILSQDAGSPSRRLDSYGSQ